MDLIGRNKKRTDFLPSAHQKGGKNREATPLLAPGKERAANDKYLGR